MEVLAFLLPHMLFPQINRVSSFAFIIRKLTFSMKLFMVTLSKLHPHPQTCLIILLFSALISIDDLTYLIFWFLSFLSCPSVLHARIVCLPTQKITSTKTGVSVCRVPSCVLSTYLLSK
jgi:hypothetical protein